jgi:hypothetical protein
MLCLSSVLRRAILRKWLLRVFKTTKYFARAVLRAFSEDDKARRRQKLQTAEGDLDGRRHCSHLN